MKSLRNIPGLLGRHYEKAILALALLGLVGAVVYLNQKKTDENNTIEVYEQGVRKPKVKMIPQVDLDFLKNAVQHATNPPALNFSQPHNLFNPVKWQQRRDGTRIKNETGKETGPEALEVVKIAPLHLTIAIDGQSGSGVNVSATQEAHTNRNWRGKMQSYLTTNSPTERMHRSRVFKLSDLKITPDGPVVEIELPDGSKHTITSAKPYSRIDGHKADLKYPPESKTFNDVRVGDKLTLANEDYIIVAIKENEIVVSARSNDRRTTIRTNAVQQ